MLEITLKNTRHGAFPGNGYGGFCIATIQPPSPGSCIMEIWKDIKGHENLYQISNYGNVRSLDRYIIIKEKNKPTPYKRYYKGKRKIPSIVTCGYLSVALYNKTIRKTILVHRLVGKAFIPNPENKPEINHKNTIKTDNRVGNLEWSTCKENMNHADKMGLRKIRGEDNGNSKLNSLQIRVIRKTKGLTTRELAKIFNIGQSAISCILRKKTWKHI